MSIKAGTGRTHGAALSESGPAGQGKIDLPPACIRKHSSGFSKEVTATAMVTLTRLIGDQNGNVPLTSEVVELRAVASQRCKFVVYCTYSAPARSRDFDASSRTPSGQNMHMTTNMCTGMMFSYWSSNQILSRRLYVQKLPRIRVGNS